MRVRVAPHASGAPVGLHRVVPDLLLGRLARRALAVGEGHHRVVTALVGSLASMYTVAIPDGADPEPFVASLGRWGGAEEVHLPLAPPALESPAPARAADWRASVNAVPEADGAGVAFVDLEWGFAEHEALPPVEIAYGVSRSWWSHGTAVLGVIVGQNDRARGIAPRARPWFASPWTRGGEYQVAAALAAAATALDPGDVLLLELQARSDRGGGVPAEVDPAVRDVVALARHAGVLTVEAAGNGGRSLDDHPVGASGALVVGAVDPDSGQRHPRSCWGRAVHACGWGEHVSTAWSNPLGTSRDAYTPSFSGTSAAAAIVAGVAVAAQSYARARGRRVLPAEMYELLSTRGRAVDGVGVLPDLEAVLAAL